MEVPSWRERVMRANKIRVNQRIYVKDFIGDPDKMAGGHFSGWTKYKHPTGFILMPGIQSSLIP